MLNILWSPATLDERRKNFYLTGSHDCNAPTLLKNTSKCCHVVRRTSYTAIGSYTREHNVAKVHHIDRLNLLQRTLRGLHDDYHTTPSMSSGSAFFLRGLREYFDFIKKNTHTHTHDHHHHHYLHHRIRFTPRAVGFSVRPIASAPATTRSPCILITKTKTRCLVAAIRTHSYRSSHRVYGCYATGGNYLYTHAR